MFIELLINHTLFEGDLLYSLSRIASLFDQVLVARGQEVFLMMYFVTRFSAEKQSNRARCAFSFEKFVQKKI